MSSFAIGQRVAVSGRVGEGTVRFTGTTQFSSGHWIGIELDAADGRNNGSVNGVVYFECAPNHGVFARPDTVRAADAPPRTPLAVRAVELSHTVPTVGWTLVEAPRAGALHAETVKPLLAKHELPFALLRSFKQGQPIELPDGTIYDGELDDEFLFHGKGVLKMKDGGEYSGEWEKGAHHGEGKLMLPSGYSYDGHWFHGKKSGHGVMTDDAGRRYKNK